MNIATSNIALGGPSLLMVAFVLATTALVVRRRARRMRLPPGPDGWPVIGSAHKLPKEREWLAYQEWSSRYGTFDIDDSGLHC